MTTKAQLEIKLEDLEGYTDRLQAECKQLAQSNDGLYTLVEHLQESSKYINEFYKWVVAIHPNVVYEFENVKDVERSVEDKDDE